MQALRLISHSDPTRVTPDHSSSPDESGVRRLPVADLTPDVEDLSDEVVELRGRVTIPPPVPVEATRASFVGLRRSSFPAPRSERERVDFELVLRSCPPPPPRPYEPGDLEDRWSLHDRASVGGLSIDPEFDRQIQLHTTVLVLSAALGMALALL